MLPDRLIAAGFHLLYHQAAWAYDTVAAAVSLGQWRAWGAAALPFLPGPRVLELGHGPGHLLVALAAAGYDAIGLDLSPQMSRQAARRVARLPEPPALIRAHASALPLPPATFDGVLAAFPTAYITAPATLAAVYRALRPGGALVLVPEARLGGRSPLVRLIDALYLATGQRATEDGGRSGFWLTQLATAGFAVNVRHVTVGESNVTVVVACRPPRSP